MPKDLQTTYALLDKYQQQVDDNDFSYDDASVSIDGETIVVVLRHKLEPWESRGEPEPIEHGPDDKNRSNLRNLLLRVERDIFREK